MLQAEDLNSRRGLLCENYLPAAASGSGPSGSYSARRSRAAWSRSSRARAGICRYSSGRGFFIAGAFDSRFFTWRSRLVVGQAAACAPTEHRCHEDAGKGSLPGLWKRLHVPVSFGKDMWTSEGGRAQGAGQEDRRHQHEGQSEAQALRGLPGSVFDSHEALDAPAQAGPKAGAGHRQPRHLIGLALAQNHKAFGEQARPVGNHQAAFIGDQLAGGLKLLPRPPDKRMPPPDGRY